MILKKITTNFKTVKDEDVINKAHLDEKWLKLNGQLSISEREYNEFKLQYNKQGVEDVLIQRAAKTTIQIHYDKGSFDKYSNTDEILKDFCLLRDVEMI